MESNQRMLRANGDEVAFSEYGDATGDPVFFFHGWPSSRTMAALAHEAACRQRVRIISPDRPGIRDSTFRTDRTLRDWPPLVQELADHLGLNLFRVLAISGGAPYAYATAMAIPERVPAIAIASGAPPIAELQDHAGLLRLYRWGIRMHRTTPRLLRALFHVAQPFASRRVPFSLRPLLLKTLQPCDADVLRDGRAFEACFESSRNAWRVSAAGVLADAEIYIRPWGFALEEVNVPVHLWHGTSDRAFHYSLAKGVSQRLPQCRLRIIEGAGHYSLPIRNMDEILADLVAASEAFG